MPGEFHNCRYRKKTVFHKRDGTRVEYGKCRKDNKNCNEYEMIGYDCYTLRDKDILPQYRSDQ